MAVDALGRGRDRELRGYALKLLAEHALVEAITGGGCGGLLRLAEGVWLALRSQLHFLSSHYKSKFPTRFRRRVTPHRIDTCGGVLLLLLLLLLLSGRDAPHPVLVFSSRYDF